LLDHHRLWALVRLPWVRMFDCRGCRRTKSYYPMSHGHGCICCHKRCWLRRGSWGCRTVRWISRSLMDWTPFSCVLFQTYGCTSFLNTLSCWTFGCGCRRNLLQLRFAGCIFAFTIYSCHLALSPSGYLTVFCTVFSMASPGRRRVDRCTDPIGLQRNTVLVSPAGS
jgi:hypothetical protein